LVTLFVAALAPWALHVPGLRAAEGAGELAIDELGDTRLLGAGAQIVSRDEAGDGGLDEGALRIREITGDEPPENGGERGAKWTGNATAAAGTSAAALRSSRLEILRVITGSAR
jgi:hypothetical protein